MKVNKSDIIIFRQDTGGQREGIVVDVSMGIVTVMTKEGNFEVRNSEVVANKGSAFEVIEKNG